MAQSTTTVEANGVQIKVWIPSDFYDLLRGRAARNKTSVAAEARNLMNAGIASLDILAEIKEKSERMENFMRLHLEPLAFISAMDASYSREAWKFQLKQVKQGEALKEKDRELSQLATARIKRKLRELDDDDEGSDDDESRN